MVGWLVGWMDGWMIRDASWNGSVATVEGWTAVQPSPARLENIHSNSQEDAAPSVVEKDPTSSLPPRSPTPQKPNSLVALGIPHTHTATKRMDLVDLGFWGMSV